MAAPKEALAIGLAEAMEKRPGYQVKQLVTCRYDAGRKGSR